MSGKALDDCITIIRTIGSAAVLSEMEGYTAALADFKDPETGELIDRVVVSRFLSPHSYTGEDLTEISCHGSAAVKNGIFRVLHSKGIRPALPGEFTKTAFINGKLDLSEAEGVMSVIKSETERSLKASNDQLIGVLSAELQRIEEVLYKALALIEMIVEFPEHDDTPENTSSVEEMIGSSASSLEALAGSYERGRLLSDRLKVALAGKPNSGKSTMLNRLLGYERAIVTDIPGTTRDTLEQDIDIDGIPVRIIDTAGIRKTDDVVETMGVKRAMDTITAADLCMFLVSPDDIKEDIYEQLDFLSSVKDETETVLVFSKSDIGINPFYDDVVMRARTSGIERTVICSALSDEDVDIIRGEIKAFYERKGGMSPVTVINRRHAMAISSAALKLRQSESVIRDGIGVDIASSVIRAALDDLGEVTGKTVSQELVNTIFSDFCIGK